MIEEARFPASCAGQALLEFTPAKAGAGMTISVICIIRVIRVQNEKLEVI